MDIYPIKLAVEQALDATITAGCVLIVVGILVNLVTRSRV